MTLQVRRNLFLAAVAVALPYLAGCAAARSPDPLVTPYPSDECPSCAGWNEPQRPFRIHSETYYVGTRGLSSLLIASPEGHVLIDGALPESAPAILASIRELGFDIMDVRLILNSHAHFDHAGGIAALQRATGAEVAATRASAEDLERGSPGLADPQHGLALDFPPVRVARIVEDGETLRVGPIALTAHLTAGHTQGGTTWSWRSCHEARCLDFVYADSQSPIAAEGFRYSESATYPHAVADFERGYALLERLPCDVLITPHPASSAFWERIEAEPSSLVMPDACMRYAAGARRQLERRLEAERSGS